MALAQHYAAAHHQGCRGKAEFLGTQEGSDHRIPTGLQLPVGLHHDSTAQSVGHQHLLSLGDSQFPREPSVFYGGFRRRTGTAIVAADQDHIAVPFGHAGRNGADAKPRRPA